MSAKKTMTILDNVTSRKSSEIEAEVTRRLPDGLRFVFGSVVLDVEDLPFDDEIPHLTGADLDWTGLDQELGDESTFRAAVEELVFEVSDRFFLPEVNG